MSKIDKNQKFEILLKELCTDLKSGDIRGLPGEIREHSDMNIENIFKELSTDLLVHIKIYKLKNCPQTCNQGAFGYANGKFSKLKEMSTDLLVHIKIYKLKELSRRLKSGDISGRPLIMKFGDIWICI